MIIPVIIISLFCTLPFSSVLYHVRVYFMRCTLYASSLILSISRREEAFPLAQHFHPDHHDPDDRVPLTVRRVFSLFLFLSLFLSFALLVFIHPAKRLLCSGTSSFSIRGGQCRENRAGARFAAFSVRERARNGT